MSTLVSRGSWSTWVDGTTPARWESFATADVSPYMYFGGFGSDYEAMWRSQPNLRTVTSFIAKQISSLPLHVYLRGEDESRERLRVGPVYELLTRPNPWTGQVRLIREVIFDLTIFDRCLLWLQSLGDDTRQLVRVHPRRWRSLWENDELVGFEIKKGETLVRLEPNEAVWFPGYDPTRHDGTSPIETLRLLLVEDAEAVHLREQTWRNGARIGGVIERPLEAPEWSDTASQRFRDSWRSWYTGGGGDAGGTPVLEDGMTFRSVNQQTFEQAQWLEGRKLTASAVAIAYHIHPSLLGLDTATYASAREYSRSLFVNALGGIIRAVEDDINGQLVPAVSGLRPEQLIGRPIYVEFHVEARLRGSFEEQAAAFQTSVGAPFMTRSEARMRLNLPFIEGSDRLVTPLNVIEGGLASPRDTGSQNRRAVDGPSVKAVTVEGMDSLLESLERDLRRVVGDQAGRVLAALRRGDRALSAMLDREEMDAEVSAVLLRYGFSAAKRGARDTLDRFDPEYDWSDDPMLGYLSATSTSAATAFNVTTMEALAPLVVVGAALAVTEEFDRIKSVRVPATSRTHLNVSTNFGSHDAAKAVDLRTKTWQVTSANPRPAHAALDGEMVALGALFSNGARWPGDNVLALEQRAGCTCVLEFSQEAT